MAGSGWFNQGADGLLEFHRGIHPLASPGMFLFDDFLDGGTIAGRWTATETGAGAGKATFAPSATVSSGALVGVAGATTNNSEEVAGTVIGLVPSTQAPVVFEVRAKFVGTTTAADGDFYLGLADAKTYTSGLPFVLGASSLFTTSAPVEFAGFGYSSIPSSGAMFNAAGNNFISTITEKNSVPATLATSTVSTTAKDSNYHVYRVVLDASANATFSLDGVVIGGKAAATTAATALTPYIAVIGKNSHANTATIDSIFITGARV